MSGLGYIFIFFLFQINDAMGNEWPWIYFDVFISREIMQWEMIGLGYIFIIIYFR